MTGLKEYLLPQPLEGDTRLNADKWKVKPGDKCGEWTVQSGTFIRRYTGEKRKSCVIVQCSCGTRKTLPVVVLLRDDVTHGSKSCGCKRNVSLRWNNRKGTPLANGEKQCALCLDKKTKDHFTIDRRMSDGLLSYCKRCQWIKRLRTEYGLSYDEFKTLEITQGNRCACCRIEKALAVLGAAQEWHVDHDHDTLMVRGLLCLPCNAVIGQAKDSIETLASAISYLSRTSYTRKQYDAAHNS